MTTSTHSTDQNESENMKWLSFPLTLPPSPLTLPPPSPSAPRSGQQLMLGDKVIVKGERLGYVAYIGKLDFDIFDQIYIGVCLDMPGE